MTDPAWLHSRITEWLRTVSSEEYANEDMDALTTKRGDQGWREINSRDWLHLLVEYFANKSNSESKICFFMCLGLVKSDSVYNEILINDLTEEYQSLHAPPSVYKFSNFFDSFLVKPYIVRILNTYSGVIILLMIRFDGDFHVDDRDRFVDLCILEC